MKKGKLVEVSRESRYGNYVYGYYKYGTYMYGNFVWKSLFVYVWVRKTLTHNKGVFGWFKFIFEG